MKMKITRTEGIVLWIPAALLLNVLLALVFAAVFPETGPAGQIADNIFRELICWGIPALIWGIGTQDREQRPGLKPAAGVLLIGIAAQLLLAAVTDGWQRLLAQEPAAIELENNAAAWMISLLGFVIVPAAAEELFFRGCLQRALQRSMSAHGAWIAASLLFTAAHGSLTGLPAQLGIGLLLGLCMDRTGSLRLCVLLHAAYNLTALVIAIYGAGTEWLAVSAGAGAVGVFLCRQIASERPALTEKRAAGWRLRLMILLAFLAGAIGYLPV